MSDTTAVIEAAERLAVNDETALEIQLGLRQSAIARDKSLAHDANLEVHYDGTLMGPLDDVRALGRRILNVWNKQLYDLMCGTATPDQADRKALLNSLDLGEAAIIAVVASAVLSLGAPAALAAVVAPLIVKRFILPAKDVLCLVWHERIEALG